MISNIDEQMELYKNVGMKQRLSQEMKEGIKGMDYKQNRRTNVGKRIAVLNTPVILTLVLLTPLTVFATINYYQQRMNSMTQTEKEQMVDSLQSSSANADSFSRELSENEKKRMEELRITYLSDGLFPEEEIEVVNDDKIVEYISTECSWAYDVTNPEEVLQNTDYLVRVKVKTKEKTKYFIKNALMPSSTYNMEILDVISPEESSLPKNIKLAVAGGVISMEEYVSSLDFETKEKLKTDELSEKELKQLIMISNESYYELEQGNEYIICIRDLTQDKDYKGYYGMPEGGYDVFQEKDGAYVNVLTQKTLVR